jgi:hypothetical protein
LFFSAGDLVRLKSLITTQLERGRQGEGHELSDEGVSLTMI